MVLDDARPVTLRFPVRARTIVILDINSDAIFGFGWRCVFSGLDAGEVHRVGSARSEVAPFDRNADSVGRAFEDFGDLHRLGYPEFQICIRIRPADATMDIIVPGQDRKSTRLNSSH